MRTLRAMAVLAAALALAAAASCRQDDDEVFVDDGKRDDYGGLVAALDNEREIDVEAAARTPGALLETLRQPHHDFADALGPHLVRASSAIAVAIDGAPAEPEAGAEDGAQDGEAGERLETTVTLAYAAPERYRTLVENSADYGREVVFADAHLYLKPRYGNFHRREPNDDTEAERLRDHVFAELVGNLELFASGLAVRDGGETQVGDRPAQRIELALADKPRTVRMANTPQRAWRKHAVVESLEGVVVLDRDTGAPLHAELRGAVRVPRDGQTVRMSVQLSHDIENIGQTPEIAVPAEDQWVATPERSRELEERDELLEDIAQPARPAPTPQTEAAGGGREGAAQENR
ncbi:hypothetical protein [Haliangium ochraceum]|nr:hypothetical protein [Haliangium ochraceum]